MSQLEMAGVATVVLGTTAFDQAAAEQWASLGFAEGSFVGVAHPLGSMPLERVLEEAERALDLVLEGLLREHAVDPRLSSNGRRVRRTIRDRARRPVVEVNSRPISEPPSRPALCDGEDTDTCTLEY